MYNAIDAFESEEDKKAKAAKKPVAGKAKETIVKIDTATLSAEKQWAYFGGDVSKLADNEKNRKLKKDIPAPKSLFDIKKNIDELFKEVGKFTDTTIIIPAREITKGKPEIAKKPTVAKGKAEKPAEKPVEPTKPGKIVVTPPVVRERELTEKQKIEITE